MAAVVVVVMRAVVVLVIETVVAVIVVALTVIALVVLVVVFQQTELDGVYVFQYICLIFCLFVCLSGGYLQKLRIDLPETWAWRNTCNVSTDSHVIKLCGKVDRVARKYRLAFHTVWPKGIVVVGMNNF